ncbi:MAG TPA: type II toxin-antitoxin system ParD family antitoxin [Rhizomicrobium sp.]|nr:type II toxin-antitoxin system ParD family antitoxin [Rhizomicrobium sp.]
MANVEKMSISLPHDLVEYVKDSVDKGSYSTASEFFRDTLRERKRREIEERYRALAVPKTTAELRRMIQEGIDSGPSIPAEEVFARLKAKYRAMAKKQSKQAAKKSKR